MLTDGCGKLHKLLIENKQALRHFDRGFSLSPSLSEKDGHRLLGNSCHMGVAQHMLDFALKHGVVMLPGPFGNRGTSA